MKSSKVAKMTSRIGQVSLITMMALTLSMGSVLAAPMKLDLYKAGTEQKLVGFHDSANGFQSAAEAVKLFNENPANLVARFSSDAKAMADGFAAVILDKMKSKSPSDLVDQNDAEIKKIEDALKALPVGAWGKNSKGFSLSKPLQDLFRLMLTRNFSKKDLEEQRYLELFETEEELASKLEVSLTPTKKEVAGPTPTDVGEQDDDNTLATNNNPIQKCEDPSTDKISGLEKGIKNLADKMANMLANLAKPKPSVAEEAQQRKNDRDESGLEDQIAQALNGLEQQARNQQPPQESGRGNQPTPPQQAQNEPKEDEELPEPQKQTPEEPQQLAASPGEQIQAPEPDLQQAPNVSGTTTAVNNLAAESKDVLDGVTTLKNDMSTKEQQYAMMFANNPAALANMKSTLALANKPRVDAAIQGLDAQIAKIDSQTPALTAQLASMKEKFETLAANSAIANLGANGKAFLKNVKDLMSQTDANIASLASNPQGQNAVAQAKADKQGYTKAKRDFEEAVAAMEPGLKKQFENGLKQIQEAEGKLAEVKTTKTKLNTEKTAMLGQQNDIALAQALAMQQQQQPMMTRGNTLGQMPMQNRQSPTTRTIPSQLNPTSPLTGSTATGTGVQRLPLNAK